MNLTREEQDYAKDADRILDDYTGWVARVEMAEAIIEAAGDCAKLIILACILKSRYEYSDMVDMVNALARKTLGNLYLAYCKITRNWYCINDVSYAIDGVRY